jgi:hypothetical protein
MSDSYTFEKKKKLIDRIKKLTSKTDWMNVKKIITDNNPELDCMKNSNGYFMQFKNLSEKTYDELTKFLDKAEKKKLKELESEILETSIVTSDEKSNSNSANEASEKNKKNMSKKLRLTNTESHILNRKKYEDELKKNEEEGTTFSDDVEKKSHKSTKTDDIFLQTGKKKVASKQKK